MFYKTEDPSYGPPGRDSKVARWLDANGIDPENVSAEGPIEVVDGAINYRYMRRYPDKETVFETRSDVLIVSPEDYGLVPLAAGVK